MRILITEAQFENLVSGKIVVVPGAEIALQDIGYERMIEIIESKIEKLYGNRNK